MPLTYVESSTYKEYMDILKFSKGAEKNDIKSYSSQTIETEVEENSQPQDYFDNASQKDLESKIDSQTLSSANEMYQKYKNMPKEDLEKEFMQESKKRLKNGELSLDKLKNTIDAISPMLNTSQKEILSRLLGEIND